jgi:hypothetical protein
MIGLYSLAISLATASHSLLAPAASKTWPCASDPGVVAADGTPTAGPRRPAGLAYAGL